MTERIEFDKSLKKDVKAFVKIIRKEGRSCQTYAPHRESESSRTNSTPSGSKPAARLNKDKTNDEKKKTPICLYPSHAEKGLRHRIRDCRSCPEEQKQGYLDAFKAAKSEKLAKKGAQRVAEPSSPSGEDSNVTFAATFGGALHERIFTDIGADENLADISLVQRVQASGGKVEVEDLVRPVVFSLAVGEGRDCTNIDIVCNQRATLNVEMHVRHGSPLMLRNLVWMITKQPMAEPLLGRPTLEILGLNTKVILAAAEDRLHGDIDIGTALPETTEGGTISRVLYDGVFHSEKGIDCPSADVEPDWLDFGVDNPEEKRRAMENMLQRASDAGLSDVGLQELREMFTHYDDIFRLRLGPGPHAKVEPMKIEQKEGTTPVRARQRRYPPAKRNFMNRVITKLQEYGFIKLTTDAEWVSAPLIVPKPPPADFRMAFDPRDINAVTIPMTWPMPNLESETGDMSESCCFASIDFPSSFWQLPLHILFQLLYAFMTDAGVFMPTRTIQGGRNSAKNFQAKVAPCFAELRHCLKSWIDDFALHTRTEQQLLSVLRRFFEICRDRNLKISARKSDLFLKELKWCGRIISKEGVRYDPRNGSGLQNCDSPINAGELCEYVHCIGWMRNGIPDHSRRVAPLRELLELAFEKTGKRTKRSIKSIPLASFGWNETHEASFRDLQATLASQNNLAHRNEKLQLCIFTDASDRFWASVVTQCQADELNKEIGLQAHQPLAFLSGEFTGAERGWTKFEKEGYAITQTFTRLDYLLQCEPLIRIFTDHINLLFVFCPSLIDPSLGRHKVSKVLRWAVFLSQFSYQIEQVDGERNVMPDIMTRWMRGYRGHRFLSNASLTDYLNRT